MAVTGKVIRAAGKGLVRVDDTKTVAGRRTVPLPSSLRGYARHIRQAAYDAVRDCDRKACRCIGQRLGIRWAFSSKHLLSRS